MSQATISTPVESVAPARDLNANDRCDRCGAQAYVAVSIKGTELLFCAHHNRAHAPALIAQGAVLITDETHKLAPTNRQQGASY